MHLEVSRVDVWVQIIAFDEVERKPNFGLRLCRVGCPAQGYLLENPHSCKDTKMATPLKVILQYCTAHPYCA